MSHRAELRRLVALSPRSLAGVAAVVLVFAPASTAVAQSDLFQDELDLTGRQGLTLGSGARAFGMTGAFLARADDATAASWNPAGLSYLRRAELSLVGNYNVFDATAGNDSDELRGGSPDFASFAWPINIKGASGSVQVNYQRAVSLDGQRIIQAETLVGTRISTGEANGGFDIIAFGAGFKLTRRLRAGATLNRWFNGYSVTLDRTVPVVVRRRRILRQEFDLRGWNSNLGLIYSPIEQLNVAGVFKTSFTGKVDLTKSRTDFFHAPSSGQLEGQTENAASSDDVRLDFPWSLGFGASWRPRSNLTVSADYTRTNWSEARIREYFTLPVTPLPPGGQPSQPPPPVPYTSLPYPYVYLNAQNDTDEIRVGVEYVLIRRRLKVPLRAGYFNSRRIEYITDLPRFNGFALGTGIILGPVLFDLAYVYEGGKFSLSSETDPGQTEAASVAETILNTVRSQRFFASFIYRFAGRP